jgi:carboxylate-amine ligase
MGMNEPSFTIGIEEEYLLVDKETRGLVIDPPETLMTEAEEKCGSQVTSELLRSQIEIGTKVCSNIQEAHEDLARLRRNVIEVANNHGLAPIAASTCRARLAGLSSAVCTCMWASMMTNCVST